MAKTTVEIKSIWGGVSPSKYFSAADQYQFGIAIDPDFPVGSEVKTSGAIVPTLYSKFSGSEVDAYPLWIVNSPKNTNTYVYQSDGDITSYSSSLGSETDVGTPTSGAGNGAAYYNNYIYFATPTDVSRYGPLSGTPALGNTFWTSTLSLTALTDTTYPTIRGVKIPNHAMHVHSDFCLYICDFKDGQGMIHRLSTKKDTYEGEIDDTTVPSAYNALDLPWGYYPVDIESYSTDIVVLAIQTIDTTVNQGPAALFFWDASSSSFYRKVEISEPIATAVKNVNGIIHVWAGNATGGFRVLQYAGGDSFVPIAYSEEGTPPFAGAVEALGGRTYFGGWQTVPEACGVVYAIGSKNPYVPQGMHSVIRSTSAGSTPHVTAVKNVLQDASKEPDLVVGWGDGSAKGIDQKASSGTYDSIVRFPFINIGQKFSVEKIQIPLAATVAANMTVTPTVYLDDNVSSGTALTAINNTNYSGQKNVVYKQPEIELNGNHNFCLELAFTGTVELPVTFPIKFLIDIKDDE